jgi:hypothetical protein
MLTIDEQQRQDWLEEYNLVVALYLVLNEGRESLRTKRAEYRNDEVQALPIDFLIDVELKAKRALPEVMYHMFLRLASTDSLEVLPEAAKLTLGMTWKEWGMGVEGSYKSLYFRTKNEQIRSFLKNLKGMTNGRFSANGDNLTASDLG